MVNNSMKSKTFYEEKNYEKALEIYFYSMNTLYDKTKNETIKKLIEKYDLKGKEVLDVGCGGGYWAKFFIERGAKVFALDTEPHLAKAAKFYLKRMDIANKACLLVADATSLALKTKFDLILAKDVIEHIKDDMSFLHNMSVLLKDKGTIIISTQNAFSLNFLIESSFNRVRGNKNWCGWDPTHLRFYTPWSLKKKVENAGLKIHKVYSSYHLPYRFITRFLFHRVYEHLAFHCLDRYYSKFPISFVGWSLICEVRKRHH